MAYLGGQLSIYAFVLVLWKGAIVFISATGFPYLTQGSKYIISQYR